MPFHFSLETLLRLRQSFERQEELLLQRANQRVQRLGQHIQEVEAAIADNAMQQSSHLQAGTSAAEVQFQNLWRLALKQIREQIQVELNHAEQARNMCMANLSRARREYEVVARLRHRQHELYFREEGRQDQRRADDLFLLRRLYLKSR